MPKHPACAHVASGCSAGLSGYLNYANFRANFGAIVLSWRDFIAFLIDNFWGHPETLILVTCTSPSELEYSRGRGGIRICTWLLTRFECCLLGRRRWHVAGSRVGTECRAQESSGMTLRVSLRRRELLGARPSQRRELLRHAKIVDFRASQLPAWAV